MNLHVYRTRNASRRRRSCWPSSWGGGWPRWLAFWTLISAGLFAALLCHELIIGFGKIIRAVIGTSPAAFFVWIPWAAFGFIWIPTSFRLSRRFAIFLDRSGKNPELRSAKHAFDPVIRCPSCGEYVSENRALCPHCYEDLLTNCVDCGKQISVKSNICRACAKKSKTRIRID